MIILDLFESVIQKKNEQNNVLNHIENHTVYVYYILKGRNTYTFHKYLSAISQLKS